MKKRSKNNITALEFILQDLWTLKSTVRKVQSDEDGVPTLRTYNSRFGQLFVWYQRWTVSGITISLLKTLRNRWNRRTLVNRCLTQFSSCFFFCFGFGPRGFPISFRWWFWFCCWFFRFYDTSDFDCFSWWIAHRLIIKLVKFFSEIYSFFYFSWVIYPTW